MIPLSQHTPVRPHDNRTSIAAAANAISRDVYWAPRSVWKIAFPAT